MLALGEQAKQHQRHVPSPQCVSGSLSAASSQHTDMLATRLFLVSLLLATFWPLLALRVLCPVMWHIGLILVVILASLVLQFTVHTRLSTMQRILAAVQSCNAVKKEAEHPLLVEVTMTPFICSQPEAMPHICMSDMGIRFIGALQMSVQATTVSSTSGVWYAQDYIISWSCGSCSRQGRAGQACTGASFSRFSPPDCWSPSGLSSSPHIR